MLLRQKLSPIGAGAKTATAGTDGNDTIIGAGAKMKMIDVVIVPLAETKNALEVRAFFLDL